MGRFLALTLTLALFTAPPIASGQIASPLAGVWTLNRSLSEFPKEIGFSFPGAVPQDGDSRGTGSSGGGRRGGGGGGRASTGPFIGQSESSEDARRRQLLLDEIRNPPARLMIVDASANVTITNELGQSRTFHPTGRDEAVEVQGVPLAVVARRDGDKLVVDYHVEQRRDIRYTFSAASPPAGGPLRLAVEVQLMEKGVGGDKATRVYEAGTGTESSVPPRVASAPPPLPPGNQQAPAGGSSAGSFDQRPGAEFKGLKNIGVLVEDFGAEAVACGLKRDVIEDALAKRLAAGGLTVKRNSDEDTYVYVNLITTSAASGTCVTRYDAFLYTHATAKLSYREQPVLVQVSLMHRGGLGASGAPGHAAAVSRGLEGYIDLFLSQIRDANKAETAR